MHFLSPLPFDATTIAAGQRVETDADIGGIASFTVKRVQLKPQALDGTVGSLSNNQFQLTLDPNSTFAKLTGNNTVTVFAANAENKLGAALANGQTVRVRSLLFFTGGTNGSYKLVAQRIQTP